MGRGISFQWKAVTSLAKNIARKSSFGALLRFGAGFAD
jgi:hypothetical protein